MSATSPAYGDTARTRSDVSPAPVQVEARACGYCRMLFVPTRLAQAFCSAKHRKAFHDDFGAMGQVASVRRINRGASVVIHLEGPAAEAALKLVLREKVRVVAGP